MATSPYSKYYNGGNPLAGRSKYPSMPKPAPRPSGTRYSSAVTAPTPVSRSHMTGRPGDTDWLLPMPQKQATQAPAAPVVPQWTPPPQPERAPWQPPAMPSGTFVNMMGGSFGGAQQPAPRPAPSLASVTTTPRPTEVFNAAQTRGQTNQAINAALMAGDPDVAMKRFDRPGISRSAGTYASAIPQMAAAQSNAAQAMMHTPLMHELLNRNVAAQGQAQQGEEALSLFDLLRRNQQVQDYRLTSTLSPLLSAALG